MTKLLIVDDEIVIREYIRFVINEENIPIEMEEACSGKEALEKVEAYKPEIVLLDIKMPGMDGLEVGSELRKNYPWLKIIILTAYDDFSYAHKAIQIGISHYLLKPIAPKDLVSALKQIMCDDSSHVALKYGDKINDYDLEHQLVESIKLNEREDAIRILEALFPSENMEKQDIGELKRNTIEQMGIIVRTVISLDIRYQELMNLKEKNQNLIFSSTSLEAIKNIMVSFVSDIMTLIESQYASPNQRLIIKAKDFIQRSYTTKIYMNDVAAYIGLSPYYFSRVFKQESGLTFTQYINKIRIEKSKEYIRNHNMSLGEIALKVGYEDFSYFSKVFRKSEGCLPSEFRKKMTNSKTK